MDNAEAMREAIEGFSDNIKEFKARYGERLDRIAAEHKERLDKLETAMRRTGHGGDLSIETAGSPEERAYKDAFGLYLKSGEDSNLRALEMKALSVSVDPDGGYLVTPAMSSRISTIETETSPMRQLAAVESITTDSLEMLADVDEAASAWVAETEARTETATPELKKIAIPVHEIYAEPRATQKLLDDSNIDAEAWLTGKVAVKFVRDEATAFVTGNGVGRPRGFTTYTAGTSWGEIEQVNSGHASQVTVAGLFDLQGSLKESYQQGAVWLMRRATVTALRKLTDGQSRPIWQDGLILGQPPTLLGHEVRFAADMAAVAGAALPIAFGNFATGYQIVDRVGVRVLRDPFTSKPYVKFYTTKRVGGAVVNFEAIKLQLISA